MTATALTIDKRFVLSSCFSVALASVHVSGQCENAIKSFRSTCITYAKAYAFKANTSPSGTTVPKLRGVGNAFATKRSIRSLNPLGSILNSSKCIFCHKTAGNRRIHQCAVAEAASKPHERDFGLNFGQIRKAPFLPQKYSGHNRIFLLVHKTCIFTRFFCNITAKSTLLRGGSKMMTSACYEIRIRW